MFTETEITVINAWLLTGKVKKSKAHAGMIVMGYEDNRVGCVALTKSSNSYNLVHYPQSSAKQLADSKVVGTGSRKFVVDNLNLPRLCLLMRHFDSEGLNNVLTYPDSW